MALAPIAVAFSTSRSKAWRGAPPRGRGYFWVFPPPRGGGPRLPEEPRIFVDPPADDGAEPRHDVSAEPTAADDDAEALSERLDGAVAGDVLRCDDDHARVA